MKIGITIGDINGISTEVIIKALHNESVLRHFTPIIYGSTKVISYYKNMLGITTFQYQTITDIKRPFHNKINVFNCWEENVNFNLGVATEEGGRLAAKALEMAAADLKAGHIQAMVTAPINKAAMQMSGFKFPGHTEFLSNYFGGEGLMMLVSDGLRVALATNHLPLKDVASAITKNLILQKIEVLHQSLKLDFGIDKPTIAVLGLNPHAGDSGALGQEEEKIIRPAIIEAKKSGIIVAGPYAADGFFGSQQFTKFDAILAMYHDQGLTPFKSLSFGSGTNFTAGLSYIRTSPDHGTGYDIVGKNEARPDALLQAIYVAYDIARNRTEYKQLRANALTRRQRPQDNEEEDEIILEEA